MRIGIPTEIKDDEYRVALTPSGVRELADHGHEVLVQRGAGEGSAIVDADESERLLRGFLSEALFEAGLYCRADDRGDPVVQLAPPLICGQAEFDEMEQILRSVLSEAWARL